MPVPVPEESRLANAFFLHPATYNVEKYWVQPMDHVTTIIGTDRGSSTIQARFQWLLQDLRTALSSIECGAWVLAEVSEGIYSLGYEDVRNAFFHFVRTIDPNEPFILASQSQGTFHLIRLIYEEIDGSPSLTRMIAAYAIGYSVPTALIKETFYHVKIFEHRRATGVFYFLGPS